MKNVVTAYPVAVIIVPQNTSRLYNVQTWRENYYHFLSYGTLTHMHTHTKSGHVFFYCYKLKTRKQCASRWASWRGGGRCLSFMSPGDAGFSCVEGLWGMLVCAYFCYTSGIESSRWHLHLWKKRNRPKGITQVNMKGENRSLSLCVGTIFNFYSAFLPWGHRQCLGSLWGSAHTLSFFGWQVYSWIAFET